MLNIDPALFDQVEPYIRIIVFAGLIIVIASLEMIIPHRKLRTQKLTRWLINFSLLFLNTGLMRIIFPLAAVGVAQYAYTHKLGLLNMITLPYWLAFLIGFVILDFCIYWQHRLFHIIPICWRIHKVHHSDLDFDTTTGFRFHPVEIILSMIIKTCIIVIAGIPILSAMVFEIVLSSTALFNHGNFKIPKTIDKYLRLFIVTPDMHRVHHSTQLHESNRNFGFNFPWWDKFFNSYQDQPKVEHTQMDIGLTDFRHLQDLRLIKLLTMPFASKTSSDS